MNTVSDFALITLDDAKNFLNLSDTHADRDTWLNGEINRQSQRIERWLDRQVKARFYREDLHPKYRDDTTLYPAHTPIIEVQNLYSDPEREFDADTRIDADHYHVNDASSVALSREYEFVFNPLNPAWASERTLRLEYIAGWGHIEIPFSRTRIDLTEESGGNRLTFTLNAGVWTPTEIVEQLNIELNTDGDNTRVVSFDWQTRQFKITQTDGTLGLLSSVTNTFTESESALPLLGFTGSGHTASPATGDTVTLDIPSDLKGAALNLLALDYDKGSYGKHKSRGLRSVRIDVYQAQFGQPAGMTSETLGMPKEIEAVLDNYKRWTFV